MAAASNEIHIGLLWHSFRSENLGVGALTVANINLIAAAVAKAGLQPVFHVFGVRGNVDYSGETPYRNDFTNIGFKALLNPASSLHRTMKRCVVFFDIGAGDSFSDIYGWKRFSLVLAAKYAAVRSGGTLVFSPQTIGPFTSRRARFLAARVVRLAERIFARDTQSLAVLGELGVAERSELTTDVAFALPYTRTSSAADRGDRIKIGFNVSALLFRRDVAVDDKIKLALDYAALVEAIIARLSGNARFDVHLVPHVLAEHTVYEDDYALALALQQAHPALIVAPRFGGPSAAKSYIAGLDFFLGSRMHATIAAISSGTAVLPLGYSRKFTGLFGSLGYDWNADLTTLTAAAVMTKLDAALATLPQLAIDAGDATKRAQSKLAVYTEYLDRLVASLSAGHA
jgi:polysaccharide pyruvyl transferase WcaK-like protein